MSADRWYAEAQTLKKTADWCAKQMDWRGAYRNYGTAIEFALKAIYLKNHQATQMPPHLQTAASHDLTFMAKQAGLSVTISNLKGPLRSNWLETRDWDQGRRYPNDPFVAQDGKNLKIAVCNPTNGVWQWLSTIYLEK